MLLKIQKILKCTRCYISVYTLIMSVLIYLPILKIVTYLTPFFSEYLSSEEGVVGIFNSAITLSKLLNSCTQSSISGLQNSKFYT